MDKEDYIYCIKDLILDILHLICIGIAITIIGTFLAILFSFFDSFSTAFMHVGTCVSIALLVNLVIVLPFGLLGVLFIFFFARISPFFGLIYFKRQFCEVQYKK